jgi:predicted nucleic acid-binding protein
VVRFHVIVFRRPIEFCPAYTDCFAAALAAHRKASLATSDKDFAHVEKKLDILWTTSPRTLPVLVSAF